MNKVRKALALHFEGGLSQRQIALRSGMARRSVSLLLERLAASGLCWAEASHLSDEALDALLYPAPAAEPPGPYPDWETVETEMGRKGVTLMLLWEEWRAAHPDGMSYPTWCRRYRAYRAIHDATMAIERRPGERLFVDYAGMTMPVWHDGELRKAQIFVAAMGVSGRLYAEATLSQKTEDWCGSHVRCFEALGALPELVVPDNLKAAVTKPSSPEPTLNRSYADMLEHYGVDALPARVGKPRDKGLVENGVRQVGQRVLAPLRNRSFHSLEALNAAIAAGVAAFNRRPYARGDGASRQSRFEAIDRPRMRPLPPTRWTFARWSQHKVDRSHHITVDRHFYSVPVEYIGKQLDVRLTEALVGVFHAGRPVATHRRSFEAGRYTTVEAHRPARHRRAGTVAALTDLEQRAERLGPHARKLVAAIIERHRTPDLAFGSCRGILNLGERDYAGDRKRFDQACRYAFELGTRSYGGLANILQAGMDLLETGDEADGAIPDHDNIRGKEYYT